MTQRNTRILLIEDHDIARKVSALVLTKLGCQVDQVETATLALAKLKDNKYDLIFVDIGLPDMDGLVLINKIRYENKLNAKVPLVILTAHEADDYKTRSELASINDFVVKPLTLEKGNELLTIFGLK